MTAEAANHCADHRGAKRLALALCMLALFAQTTLIGWRSAIGLRLAEASAVTYFNGERVICLDQADGSTHDKTSHCCDDCPICHGLRLIAWFAPLAANIIAAPVARQAEWIRVQDQRAVSPIERQDARPRGPPISV